MSLRISVVFRIKSQASDVLYLSLYIFSYPAGVGVLYLPEILGETGTVAATAFLSLFKDLLLLAGETISEVTLRSGAAYCSCSVGAEAIPILTPTSSSGAMIYLKSGQFIGFLLFYIWIRFCS